MKSNDVWQGEKHAALLVLRPILAEHQVKLDFAKVGVVYMRGGFPGPGTHPAIVLTEHAHLVGQVRDAKHHEAQVKAYTETINKIEALTNEKDK